MARRTYEKRSLGDALQTYLTSKGWTTITYADGYKSQATVKNPQVTITMPPSTIKELQLGRIEGGARMFSRRIQVDAYMESEPRADAIIDDIMDFIDLVPVSIVDPTATVLGTLICYNTESIYGETLPPATSLPTVLKWRGVVRAEMEALYPAG